MKYVLIALLSMSASFSISNFSLCNCTQYTTLNDCQSGKCTWSNSTSSCGPFNCIAVQSYQTCIDQNTCAWVNNTCTYFTKCSDYSSNSNSTCEVQGQNCTTTTTANGTGFSCAQMVQNYMQILPTFDCSSFTQSTCTNKYCMFMNNVCMSLTCSMSTQQQCTYTFLGDYRVMTLCQWTGTKCQDAPNTNFLTQQTCFTNTQGYYYWDSNSSSCRSCSGYSSGQIMIMSLILIFISFMKQQIILFLVGVYTIQIDLTTFKKCQCNQLMSLKDCVESSCNWSADRCQDYECNQVRNFTLCSLIDHCAWDQYQCKAFTQCSDYFQNDNASCYIQGPRCLPSSISINSQYRCIDNQISKFKTNYIGYNCSKATTSRCNYVNGCVYKSQQCQQQTCEDILTEEYCRYVPNMISHNLVDVCYWNGFQCSQAINSTLLNQKNCFDNTGGTYSWNSIDQVCSKCQAYILIFYLLIIII